MKTKRIKVRLQIGDLKLEEVLDLETVEEIELCGLSDEDVISMILDQGISGLSNYVGHTENWIEENGE